MKNLKGIAITSFLKGAFLAIGFGITSLLAVTITGTINTFTSGDILDSGKMNQNFTTLKTSLQSIDPQYPLAPESPTPSPTHKLWYDGRPIYRLVVDIGSLPNATTKNIAHGISTPFQVVSITGMVTNGTNQRTIPCSDTSSLANNIDVQVSNTTISVITGTNWNTYTGKVILEYIK